MENITLFLFIALLICGCKKTSDPNYLPIELNNEAVAPWDAPVYTESEMITFFASTDYSSLTSIYVSTSGNDENGDGSISNPYLSIQLAINNHQEPGTIIRVKQGVYKEHIKISTIGTKPKAYVIFSEDGRGAAILDGENQAQPIVAMTGQHNVIDGLEIKNSTDYGISIFVSNGDEFFEQKNSFAVVRNCIVQTIGRDMIKSGQINFQLIEDCEIFICTNTVQNDNAIDGVGVYHTLCRRNYIHDIVPGFGGYFKSGSHNNIWSNNIFKDIGDPNLVNSIGAAIQFGGAGESGWRDDRPYEYPSAYEQIAYNNLFINCSGGAVTFTSCWNSKVYNNSMFNCGYVSTGLNVTPAKSLFAVKVSPSTILPSKEIEIYNNISYHDPSFETEHFFIDQGTPNTLGQLYHGNNTIYNNQVPFTWGVDDPELNDNKNEFFEYINESLEVDINSPVVNSGFTNNYVLQDYLGIPRPIGIIDRGAYEK